MVDKKRYYYALNSLRFIFILGIVLFHTHSGFNDPYYAVLRPWYVYGGGLGNVFFFISSGFLIAASYPGAGIESEKTPFYVFFRRRLLAIYPLFFVSNIVQIIFNLIDKGVEAIDFYRIFFSLLFISEGWINTLEPYNYPTWFVCVLVLCYVIYYAIYRFSNSKTVFVVLIVIFIFWGYICRSGAVNFPFCYPVTGVAEMNFFIGCLLYEITTIRGREKAIISGSLYTAFLLLIIFSAVNGFSNVTSDTGAMISFVIIPSIILFCSEKTWIDNICENIVLVHAGKISMHIFFWHIPAYTLALYFINNIGMNRFNSGAYYIIYFCALIFIAEISAALNKKATNNHYAKHRVQ